jgi:hypothetical protein
VLSAAHNQTFLLVTQRIAAKVSDRVLAAAVREFEAKVFTALRTGKGFIVDIRGIPEKENSDARLPNTLVQASESSDSIDLDALREDDQIGSQVEMGPSLSLTCTSVLRFRGSQTKGSASCPPARSLPSST